MIGGGGRVFFLGEGRGVILFTVYLRAGGLHWFLSRPIVSVCWFVS